MAKTEAAVEEAAELRATKAEGAEVEKCMTGAEGVPVTGCATTGAAIECVMTEIKAAVKGCVITMATVEEITTDEGIGAAVFGFTTTMMADTAAATAIAGDRSVPTAGVGVDRASGAA